MPRKSRRRIRSHNRSLRKPLRKNTRRRRTRRSHNRSLRKPLRKNMRGGAQDTRPDPDDQLVGTEPMSGRIMGGLKAFSVGFVPETWRQQRRPTVWDLEEAKKQQKEEEENRKHILQGVCEKLNRLIKNAISLPPSKKVEEHIKELVGMKKEMCGDHI